LGTRTHHDKAHRSFSRIHQFDGGGRYLGYFEREGECRQLTVDREGTLSGLFNPQPKIVRFASQKHFAGQGIYFSKVLDSTIHQCQWHRIMLEAEIPAKTRLEVYFYSSDNPINPSRIDPEDWHLVLSSPHNSLETKDALFEQAQGRYLILRFNLFGDGNSSPQIETVRIYFQRQSYLRYLPATYQEDPRGRDFLERFLSIFESMFLEMEEKIAGINQYWDVMAVNPEFLEWLASWLGIINDEQWSEEKRRELLKQAFPLFKLRGTKKGLRQIIKIFTGREVQIVEHFRLRPPMVLGQGNFLGLTTFVGPKPTPRLILGEESARIGEFLLTDEEDSPEKPFEYDAYDFTVLADTSELKDEAQEQALRRLIEQEKPAYTRYFLHTTQNAEAQLGKHGFLGVDTVLTKGYQPMRLGQNSKIGITTLLGTKYPLKGTVGIRSKISVDAILH
jgi:phage tail-like protein